MQGDLVIARAYGGVPIVRRVWSESAQGVWITDESNFELLCSGKGGIEPSLGFPRNDVFKYDPNLTASIDELEENEVWDWNQLTPY